MLMMDDHKRYIIDCVKFSKIVKRKEYPSSIKRQTWLKSHGSFAFFSLSLDAGLSASVDPFVIPRLSLRNLNFWCDFVRSSFYLDREDRRDGSSLSRRFFMLSFLASSSPRIFWSGHTTFYSFTLMWFQFKILENYCYL